MTPPSPAKLAAVLATEGPDVLAREPSRTLADGLTAAVAVLDASRQTLRTNAAGRDLLGGPDEPCHVVLHGRGLPCPECPLATGLPFAASEAACHPLADAQGAMPGVVCVFEPVPNDLERDELLAILDAAPAAICVADRALRIRYANDGYARLYGRKRRELIGSSLRDLLGEQTFARFEQGTRRAVSEGAAHEEEVQVVVKGQELPLLALRVPIMRNGLCRGICGMLMDITSHKTVERELRESRRRYQAFLDDQTDLVMRLSPDLHRTFVNQAVGRLLGEPCDNLLGRRFLDRVPEDDATRLHRQLMRLTPRSPVCDVRHLLTIGDGSERCISWTVRAIFDENGRLGEYQAMGRDVTAYWLMEQELLKSEAKYRDIFEHSAEGIFQFDPSGAMVACNPALARVLGYASAGEVLLEPGDFFLRIQARQDEHLEFLRLLAQNGRIFDFEMQVVRRDGRTAWLSINARAVLDDSGHLTRVEGAARDITDRKRAEDERMLLVSAVDQSAEGLVIVSRDFRLEYANPAFAQIVGSGQSGGQTDLSDLLEPFLSESVRKMLGLGLRWSGRVSLTRPGGDDGVAEALISPVRDAKGSIVNHIMLVRDMTYELGLEKRLRQAEKLEAIGVLAGGVAHDFNNILTPILLNTEMILADIPWQHPLRKPLADVVRASERARDLVRQLLTFSRQGELTIGDLPLTPLVRETLKLMRGMIDARVKLRQKVTELSLIVRADPAQIHQVLLNLCLNAAQAMTEGGVMEVGLSPVPEPPRPENGVIAAGMDLSRLEPGAYARIWVSDNGHGMTQEVCEHIFEPFFTTKKPGQGTGMGLAAVHGIIKSCGGAVLATSTPGQGSLFEIFLPLLPRPPR